MSERNWEPLEKQIGGAVGTYGSAWKRYPAVSINKTGFSINKTFAKAFIRTNPCAVFIVIDTNNRILGLKLVSGDDPTFAQGYSLRLDGGGRATVTCKAIHQRFPDAVGYAYRAQKTPGEAGIIEIELSPANRLK